MQNNISGGFTFYGYIPDNSIKQHVGIVLGINDPYLKYCYCRSKKYKKIINNIEHIKIPASIMAKYYDDPRDSYIIISEQHIIKMFLITFQSRLSNLEYEEREPIDNGIFSAILSKIQNSNNLSDRFKNEFFAFIDNAD
jgi:hypothetical protein